MSAGLESERQALGTKSEVRRPVCLLLVRGHGIALWEEPRGAACWAYPGARCDLRRSAQHSALWSSRGARIEGVRPNDATADTAASGTRQHGPTAPRSVRSAVRSAVRSRRSAVGSAAHTQCGSAAHTQCECHALRFTAAARAPRIPTRCPADTTGSNRMRFAWYLEINHKS